MTTPDAPSFQSQIPDNYCFGCGSLNPEGLQIQSYWSGPGESVCRYTPLPYQAAGPKAFLNGGIIATLIDCHTICTAVANAYRLEERELSSAPLIWYVTASLRVTYRQPTPIDEPVELEATFREFGEKKAIVACTLSSGRELCAEGEVVAVRVPLSWRQSGGHSSASSGGSGGSGG